MFESYPLTFRMNIFPSQRSCSVPDEVLELSDEGNAKLHNAFKDKSYVKKISSQVKPDVKFKSTQNTSSQLKLSLIHI